jgi:hypothetical protein
MTVSGAWSRYRRALRPRSPRLGRWQQVLADGLDKNVAIGVRAAVADHLGRALTRAELNGARRAAPVSPCSAVPKCFMCRGPTRMLIQATATAWSWQSRT